MSVADVLDRLDGVRQTRRGWSARCPAHRDRSPSLSIAEGDGGKPLLFCHAGCRYQEIASALSLERSERMSDEPSVIDALTMAGQQPWHREEIRLHYHIADAIRHHRYRADRIRRAVTGAGESQAAWLAAARAADLDRDAERFEAMLEEALR